MINISNSMIHELVELVNKNCVEIEVFETEDGKSQSITISPCSSFVDDSTDYTE